MLLDPSATDAVDLGREVSALAQTLDHNAIPVFDNLSRIPSWAGDLLCRAVTGGGFSKRELYTDSEDVILAFKRAVIITGINIPTHAPDLLDRMLLIEIERIAPDKRRDEGAFWKDFEAERSRLFGAVLDAVAGTLRNKDRVQLERLPRMADFAKLACAYGDHSGLGAEKMIAIIADNAGRQIDEVIESDPFAMAIRDHMKSRDNWKGTVRELMQTLDPESKKPDGWPKDVRQAGRRLRVLQATLADAGFQVKTEREGKDRTRAVMISKLTSATSAMSAASTGAPFDADMKRTSRDINADLMSAEKPNENKVADMKDVEDIKLHPSTAAKTGLEDNPYWKATRGE